MTTFYIEINLSFALKVKFVAHIGFSKRCWYICRVCIDREVKASWGFHSDSGLGPTKVLPYQVVELLVVGAEESAQPRDYVWVHIWMLSALGVLQTLVCSVALDAVKS
jgi:hypothetical protein